MDLDRNKLNRTINDLRVCVGPQYTLPGQALRNLVFTRLANAEKLPFRNKASLEAPDMSNKEVKRLHFFLNRNAGLFKPSSD
jgi:hypothetical protein